MKDIEIDRAVEIGELRGVLKARQIRQDHIAEASDVAPSTISRQLKGERHITLAEAFDYGYQVSRYLSKQFGA